MRKYINPDLKITYFNSENIAAAEVSGTVTDPKADIQNYADKTAVRLKEIDYNNVLEFK